MALFVHVTVHWVALLRVALQFVGAEGVEYGRAATVSFHHVSDVPFMKPEELTALMPQPMVWAVPYFFQIVFFGFWFKCHVYS